MATSLESVASDSSLAGGSSVDIDFSIHFDANGTINCTLLVRNGDRVDGDAFDEPLHARAAAFVTASTYRHN